MRAALTRMWVLPVAHDRPIAVRTIETVMPRPPKPLRAPALRMVETVV